MQTIQAVKKQIKFLLSDLPSQNGHFTFEEICRNYARQRIGLNILPATGPVATGGDQGRDFETFKVFLADSRTAETSFQAGLVASGKLAFGCTTQKTNLSSKIKADIKKIVDQGTPVDGTYYFVLQDLPVAERHELQAWSHDTYSLPLEIIDGEALSEQLSDKDLFWIAEEYLSIPSEIFPPIEDAEYQKLKSKWKDRVPTHQNYAEFDELKWTARGVLFDKALQHDLLFWIQKLETYFELEGDLPLKRKAAYEAIAIRIRGTRTLIGREEFVRKYFGLGEFTSPVETEDAIVLLQYAQGSTRLGTSHFTQEELAGWRERIESYLDKKLGEEQSVTVQAVLYEAKGQLCIGHHSEGLLNEGINWWMKLAELIEKTPLFPLERFSEVLTVLVPFIGDHPKFDELTSRVDALLSMRVGGFAAADNSRDRSIQFYENEQLIKAIKELHKAKEHWFTSETLNGSLVAMLLLSQWYLELGLTYASKYYGMAVAYMASRSREEDTKPFLPRGFAAIAKAEYAQGNWASFLERAEMVLRGMGAFSADIDQSDTSFKMFQEMLFYTGNVAGFSKVASSDLTQFVGKRVGSWGIRDWTDEIITISEEVWEERSKEKTIEVLEENLYGVPFSDVGARRSAAWQQLGVTWRIEWKNSFLETSKAEHFIAILQILLADLAREDLYLLPVTANISIDLEDREKFHIVSQHSNSEYKWALILRTAVPSGLEEIHDFNMEVFSAAFAVLAEISLLPDEEVLEKLDGAMKEGVLTKTFTVSSYETMYRDLTSTELFEEASGLTNPELGLDFAKKVHGELAWRDGLISEYSKSRSSEDIENRYKRSLRMVKLTLPKLLQSEEFRKAVAALRAKGWKDWHILMALGSVAMNYRMLQQGIQSKTEMLGYVKEQIDSEENSSAVIVPLGEFSQDNLELHLYMTMPSTLKLLGLHIKSGTPHKEGLKKFLGSRYRYWDDDIDHQQIFD